MKLKERQPGGIAELSTGTIIVLPSTSGEDRLPVLVFDLVRGYRLGVTFGTKDEGCFRASNVVLAQGNWTIWRFQRLAWFREDLVLHSCVGVSPGHFVLW